MKVRQRVIRVTCGFAVTAALVAVAGALGSSSAPAPKRAPYASGQMKAPAAIAGPAAPAIGGVGIPAQVLDFTPEKTFMANYDTTDYGATDTGADDRLASTQWRVVVGTGNCCETHVTTSKEGRIYDIGGHYIRYSDDRGVTWKSVQPVNPLVNGEGSIAMAPNDDVIAMTWDAYSGDHFVAYKYDKAANQWLTLDNVLHQPVYDRPWISVVPGPFPTGLPAPLDVAPYLSFVHGGTGVKDPLWVSTDGLSYQDSSSFIVDGQLDQPVTQWFPIAADASFDWIQPIRSSPVTGLGAGKALAAGNWLLNPQDRRWDQWRLPDPPNAMPPQNIQIDSAGRINHVRSVTGGFEYRISTDNGQTWTTSGVIPFSLAGLSDFKANYAAGVAAIAARISNQDWAYKLDISGSTARLIRRYKLGLGDIPAVAGVQVPPRPRYDFKTIAILPDGKITVSMLDSQTRWHPPGVGGINGIEGPATAIEGDTTFPTAVTISSFRTQRAGSKVVLRWRTGNEIDVVGFDLYRGQQRLNRALIRARYSGQARGASYSFRTQAARGAYRLRVAMRDGSASWQRAS